MQSSLFSPSTSYYSLPSNLQCRPYNTRDQRALHQHLRYHDPQWEDLAAGPIPRWMPDSRKPWKPGQETKCWIWPRDKRTKNPSWQRFKDIMTGKGPPVFVGSRLSYYPNKSTWSNWNRPPFDNLGYYEGDFRRTPVVFDNSKRYDFNKRRYTKDWCRTDVWSDVKWGKKGRHPLYWRDGWGREFTRHNGLVHPLNSGRRRNDFRYNENTPYFDWARPEPHELWETMDD